jgi:toxin FitB
LSATPTGVLSSNDWLVHKVRPMFEQRILAITEDIMFKWRLLVEDGRKAGQKARAPVLNPWVDPPPEGTP